jgi:hypothetical protein
VVPINQLPPDPPTVSFAADPNPVLAGDPVVFTDTTAGDHTVVSWSAPGGAPSSPSSPGSTFVTSFIGIGTVDVTLTIDGPAGVQSVTEQVVVEPNLTLGG